MKSRLYLQDSATGRTGLRSEGVVVNQFQPRAHLPQRTVQGLIDEGLPVLQPHISASVKIKESYELAKPVVPWTRSTRRLWNSWLSKRA